MCVAHRPGRWILCFVVLPALWIAFCVGTNFQAVFVIPAAAAVALLSALIAYRSGRGTRAAFGYFFGTGLMMVVALVIAIATIFTIVCGDGSTEGVC